MVGNVRRLLRVRASAIVLAAAQGCAEPLLCRLQVAHCIDRCAASRLQYTLQIITCPA